MSLRHLRLLLLSLCVFLSVLGSSSHIAHATESDEIIITVDPNSSIYIDPNSPMLLDEDIMLENTLEYGSAYYKDGKQVWYNYMLNPLNLNAGTYDFLQQIRLKDQLQPGTYDLTITLQIPKSLGVDVTLNAVEFRAYSPDNSHYVCGPLSATTALKSKNDSTSSCAVYSLFFDDIEVTGNTSLLRLNYNITLPQTMDIQLIPYVWKFKTIEKTTGLLNNIIQIVNNIKDGIINLPSKIASSIKGFFDSVVSSITTMMNTITNALTSLGNFLIDGIKGLFVPSSEDLQAYFDSWKALLSDRFGALYEVFDIIVSYFQSFSNAASTVSSDSTITFPSVSIPLAGSNFVFGGWEVNLIPTGFTVIFDALKMMINVVCTIAFVNSLRRRYDKVVEK